MYSTAEETVWQEQNTQRNGFSIREKVSLLCIRCHYYARSVAALAQDTACVCGIRVYVKSEAEFPSLLVEAWALNKGLDSPRDLVP